MLNGGKRLPELLTLVVKDNGEFSPMCLLALITTILTCSGNTYYVKLGEDLSDFLDVYSSVHDKEAWLGEFDETAELNALIHSKVAG